MNGSDPKEARFVDPKEARFVGGQRLEAEVTRQQQRGQDVLDLGGLSRIWASGFGGTGACIGREREDRRNKENFRRPFSAIFPAPRWNNCERICRPLKNPTPESRSQR